MKYSIIFKLTLITAIFTIIFIIFYIPQHMDEYLMYNSLACLQKQQSISIYRDGCELYPVVFGALKYRLSYIYIGISSSLFLLPFQNLFDSIWTQYFVGILSLILIILGTAKSFRITIQYLPLSLLFFPIVFSILRDGGPIRLSLICISWTPYLFRKYLEQKGIKKLLLFLLISLSWIISVEDKPFFIFLIPGTVLLMLSALHKELILEIFKRRKLEMIKIFSSLTFFCFLFLTLLRMEEWNKPYLIWLMGHPRGAGINFLSIFDPLKYTFYWPQYLHRVVHFSESHALILKNFPVLILAISTIIISVRYYYVICKFLVKSKEVQNLNLLLLLSSYIIFNLCIFISGGALHHHYVFAQYPLLIALLIFVQIKKEKAYFFTYKAFVSLILLSFVVFTLSSPKLHASKEIPKIFNLAIKNADEESIINCSSWGCYFNYALSNSKEIPIVYGDKIEYMKDLSKKSKQEKSNILHICQSQYSEPHKEPYENDDSQNTICNKKSLIEIYETNNISEIENKGDIWKLFKIIPKVK